jgi:hypothetical protein
MPQMVCGPSLTAEVRVRTRPIHVKFVVHKMALGQAFLLLVQFSPANIIPHAMILSKLKLT